MRLCIGLFAVLISACAPPALGPAAPNAEVIRIVDGDTVVVRTGSATENVRLIGIDTPEVGYRGQPNDCFGPEAAARTAELLPIGSTVRLARDIEARDVYDRLLAYVFAPDGSLVNLQLAAEGFATELAIAPNIAIADDLAAAVSNAKRASAGMWASCDVER